MLAVTLLMRFRRTRDRTGFSGFSDQRNDHTCSPTITNADSKITFAHANLLSLNFGSGGIRTHGHPIKSRMLNLRAPDPSLDNLIAFVLQFSPPSFRFRINEKTLRSICQGGFRLHLSEIKSVLCNRISPDEADKFMPCIDMLRSKMGGRGYHGCCSSHCVHECSFCFRV